MENITRNIAFLQKKIAAACDAAGRHPREICIIAVAKSFNAEKIRAAAAAGIANIGENYMQESIAKMAQLSELPLLWHFIGHLQKNKSKDAARHFGWVHTIDGAVLARRLSAAREGLPPLSVCLQINIDGETGKSGATPENAPALAREIAALPNLRLRGLMAVPSPLHENKRAPYRALAVLRDLLAEKCRLPLDALSMGMSDDFESAIAEGATHIRIGRGIFGFRETKPKRELP
ncbi:MAG: YggS family pyridoxal phosphate-dependent enzyme [Gammaproteobacteria bacterium]